MSASSPATLAVMMLEEWLRTTPKPLPRDFPIVSLELRGDPRPEWSLVPDGESVRLEPGLRAYAGLTLRCEARAFLDLLTGQGTADVQIEGERAHLATLEQALSAASTPLELRF